MTDRTLFTGQIQRPAQRPENVRLTVDPVTPYILRSYRLPIREIDISSGAVVLDYLDSNAFDITLTENITSITLLNAPILDEFGEIIIRFIQDGTGSRTVAGWPASVKWPGGTAPAMTATATTGVDLVALKTLDGGATWYGDYSQDYS